MLAPPNLGTPLDPNTQRALEELAFVINDVEQRLQLIRMGLAQNAPAWPGSFAQGIPQIPQASFQGPFPSVGNGVGNLQTLLSNPLLLQQLLATQGRVPPVMGIPNVPFGGSPFQATAPFQGGSPFGSPVGVSAPFGITSPFQAPFTPFRY